MSEKVAAERVMLSPYAVAAWQSMCERISSFVKERNLPLEQVGQEELWLQNSGSLELRVRVGPLSMKMDVPPEHWHWRKNN